MTHPTPTSLEVARERTIQALCQHFAYDRLTTEQVDERLEHAQKARSVAELDALLADLPPADRSHLEAAARPYQMARPGESGESLRLMAFMSEVKRTGSWTLPRYTRVAAIMGQITIDLRAATLQPGVSEIHIGAFMSGVKILVPPGVRVETTASAIMGAVSDDAIEGFGDDPAMPIIRVTGFACMAEIKTRLRAPLLTRLLRGEF